jgi:hypothetical protein
LGRLGSHAVCWLQGGCGFQKSAAPKPATVPQSSSWFCLHSDQRSSTKRLPTKDVFPKVGTFWDHLSVGPSKIAIPTFHSPWFLYTSGKLRKHFGPHLLWVLKTFPFSKGLSWPVLNQIGLFQVWIKKFRLAPLRKLSGLASIYCSADCIPLTQWKGLLSAA